MPGIFQDPEAVITTSVDPKNFPEIESVIEKKKDVELTGEQEKKGKLISNNSFICILNLIVVEICLV